MCIRGQGYNDVGRVVNIFYLRLRTKLQYLDPSILVTRTKPKLLLNCTMKTVSPHYTNKLRNVYVPTNSKRIWYHTFAMLATTRDRLKQRAFGYLIILA